MLLVLLIMPGSEGLCRPVSLEGVLLILQPSQSFANIPPPHTATLYTHSPEGVVSRPLHVLRSNPYVNRQCSNFSWTVHEAP